MEVFTQENKPFANDTGWLPWSWAPVKFMVNGILQAPSAFYSLLPRAVDEEEPLALYAYRTDPGYQHYQNWCSKLRVMLRELKQVVRNIDASRNKGVVTPSLTEILLEKQQYHINEAIISPLYYDQQLVEFENKIVNKWNLSEDYAKEIAKVRAQLKIQLENHSKQALECFYHDTINLIIQQSNQSGSLAEELKALSYYQNLVPVGRYQVVTNCIQNFIKQYSYSEENINRYMPSFRESNRFCKKLLQQVNAVFKDYRYSEHKDLVENFQQNILVENIRSKSASSVPSVKTLTTKLATTIALATFAYSYIDRSDSLNQNDYAGHWDTSFSPLISLWDYLIPSVAWMSPLAFTYGTRRINSLPSTWIATPLTGLLTKCMTVSAHQLASSHQYPASFDLSNLNGKDGFVINSVQIGNYSDRFGTAIASGDINGDGFADVLIGAYGASPGNRYQAGASYVVFGHNGTFTSSLELSALNGKNGFVINGANPGDQSGESIASGDINGDGFADVLIGAYGASPGNRNQTGASYVIFGHNGTFTSSLELSALNGKNGFVINGVNPLEHSGIAISSGDINGDGFADVLIGAYGASPGNRYQAGASYVVFGHNGTFTSSLELSALNGNNGFVINGTNPGDISGSTVSSGDINGDGFADILIGAGTASPNRMISAGASYVIFGHNGTFTSSLELSALNGNNGFVINGANPGDNSGNSLGSGDINGDGFADVLIGAYEASPGNRNQAGASYVVFGHNGTFTSSLELSALNGNNGFVINGANPGDNSGGTVSSGDINGDGFADILIGADTASPNRMASAGASYVVFGHNGTFTSSLELSALNGQAGFVLNGANANDYSGIAIASGDIDGDHVEDILIGAPGTNGQGVAGETSASYVVFAQNLPLPIDILPIKEKPFQLRLILGIVGGSVAALSLLGGSLFYYYKKRQRQDKELDDFVDEQSPLLGHELPYVPVGNYRVLNKITQAQAEEVHKQAGIKLPVKEGQAYTEFTLGRGQYGEVLIAQQRKTKEYLACKIIRGEEAIRASKYEVKLQQKLKNKPHIMPLIDSIEAKDDQSNPILYQFLPLAGFGNGKTLKKVLAQLTDAKMKDKIIVHVAKSLLIALQGAHGMHMYHLDIKPKNFVMNQKGYVYLIDFGCMVEAALSSAMITPVYDEQGKPITGGGDIRYFSPERLEAINNGKPFDGEKADAWALGVTLLELAINNNPFNQKNLQDIQQIKNILNTIFQDKDTRPTSYWLVIQSLLEPNPEERLSIEEVLEMPLFKRKNPNITFSSEQEQEGVFSLLQDLIATKTTTQMGQNILNILGTETNENSSSSKFFSASSSSLLLFKPEPPVKASHYGVSIQVHDEIQNENNKEEEGSSFGI